MSIAITRKVAFTRALSSRQFALLWTGQTISSLGDGAYTTALAWQVLELTGSATAMGVILIAQSLPMILFLLLGGVVADRFPRKQVMLLSDASRGVAVLALAVLALTHTLQFWHLVVLALFFGIVRGFFMPAYQSLIPHLVSKDQLASANSLTELSYQIYALLGPIVGASCVAFGGPAAAFGFDGLTFLISALCLFRLHLPTGLSQATSSAPSLRSETKATAYQMREGLGYVARSPFLWITMALAAISSIGGAGALQVALPKLVVDVYGQGVWFLGLIWAAGGAGSLLAILLTAQFNRLRHRGIVLYLTMAVSGLALTGFALPLTHGVEPVVACTAMALLTASMTLHEILWATVMQERVPDDKLGRVSSINQLAGYGFWPLGFAGAIADQVSPAMVFLGTGIVIAVLYSLCLGLRSIRNEAFEEQRKEKRMIRAEVTRLEPLEVALTAFHQQYPTFATTRVLDELRATEYARLDRHQHVYLDYTGGGLYAECQLRDYFQLITHQVFGNPHSTNPASQVMNTLVEQARRYVLDYFRASPEEYLAIFTPNATGAVKLVAEAYPFAPGGQYLLTFDNHNAVNGVCEFARAKGATVGYVPVEPPDMRVNEARLSQALSQAQPGQHNLFAFPAQSNVTGVQHALEWIAQAQAQGWDVLLDAAAFAPTNRLDLSTWHPDFVPLSFYKIFGFPTGAGCLLVRKSAQAKLRRPWFSGGTNIFTSVIAADASGFGFYLSPGEAGFEDGTLNYLLLPAVEIGLRYIESIGIEVIHERIRCLTGWLLEQMLALRHSNGQPVVRIYGPTTTERRGGTIAFNVCDPAGAVLDCYAMQEQANRYEISVRSGCFCNPGVREVALGFVREDLANSFRNKEWMTFEQFLHVIDHQKQGAVRVSIGLSTNFDDVYQFVQFVRTCIDRHGPLAEKTVQPQQVHLPLSEQCVCGYQDHRARKAFCPQCGRPLTGVAHPSVKARSSHLEYAGGGSPPGCPALSLESLM